MVVEKGASERHCGEVGLERKTGGAICVASLLAGLGAYSGAEATELANYNTTVDYKCEDGSSARVSYVGVGDEEYALVALAGGAERRFDLGISGSGLRYEAEDAAWHSKGVSASLVTGERTLRCSETVAAEVSRPPVNGIGNGWSIVVSYGRSYLIDCTNCRESEIAVSMWCEGEGGRVSITLAGAAATTSPEDGLIVFNIDGETLALPAISQAEPGFGFVPTLSLPQDHELLGRFSNGRAMVARFADGVLRAPLNGTARGLKTLLAGCRLSSGKKLKK